MSDVQPASTIAEATGHKSPNYAAVFWALLVLTIFEIIVANLPGEKLWVILGLVVLAVIKASLVALFYMHLKFEKFIFYLIVAFPLFLAAFLTLMILADQAPRLM